MSRKIRIIAFLFLAVAFLPVAAIAQIGGSGWKTYSVKFNVQSPTNAPQSQRYFVTNMPQPTYHCLVFSNDGAFSVGNTTLPRTEQRFTPDYTNGEIQYQALLMCPSNENSYCCFQVHTGDAQSDTFGSTTFMIFWFTNSGGSVHDYSGTTLATGLGNKWFQLNFDHNIVTRQIRAWVNGKQVWAQQDNGAGDFYLKDGVYEQSHSPTLQMDTYITNILMWTNSGINPPPAPTNLVATPTATKISLTWLTAWDQTNFTFNVKRATVSGGPYATLTNLHGTTYTDTNVVVGTNYYYVVSAINQFGEGSNSMQAAAALFNLGFQLSASPPSITMLAGGSTNFTVTMTANSSYSGTTTLGVSGLPAGATPDFSPPALSIAGNSTLTISTTTNTTAGTYTLMISGTNGANIFTTTANLILTTLAANPGTLIWTGSGADTNWSTVVNWTNTTAGGFGPPGTNNDVVFTNAGVVANSALMSPGSGIVIPANINSVANGNFPIASWTNFNNGASANYQNVGIASNGTVTVAGNFQLGDNTAFDFGANNVANMTVSGAGATLVVNSNFWVIESSGSGGAHNATLDLSGLDNFTMNAGQIRVGVEGSSPHHFATGCFYLAKTNNLTLNLDGTGAFYIGHNKSSAPSIPPAAYLGIQNNFYFTNNTGVIVGRANTPGSLLTFNPAFVSQNPSAYFRGSNDVSPVATWSVGDNSANSTNSPNATSGTNDFSGGNLDAFIGLLQLGVSCPAGLGGSGNGTGTFTFGSGTLDVNILQLGVDTGNTGTSAGIGVMNVNGGSLIVNSNLQLGVFVAGSGGAPRGTLNVNNDGTVSATNIGGGGISTINLNSGILNLQGGGQITNITTLAIGDGVSDSALLTGAATISSPNAITIAANGTLSGNTIISTPNLIVNGLLSPGIDGVGAMTNNGPANFGAGGNLSVTVQNASSAPVSGWDFLQVNGTLNISASNANQFTIQLESFDPNGSGLVTNFNSVSSYDWTIATANGGIANFSTDKFVVDTSQFQNSLNGGYFYVHTSGNSLVLSFTNPPPTPMPIGLSQNGTNFIFSGSNGTAGGQYYVLASTNVALPPAQWTVIATNNFDGNGNFNFTNPADPTSPQMFYLLQLR